MSKGNEGGIRRHFNYSNVMSTLAVFMVIAGGTAVAATVGKDEVGSKQVKDNSLKSKDIKDGKAVGGVDVIDDSLTGADINESQLALPASPSSLPPSGAAGGGLAGTYPNPTIANNAVGTANLQDNAVNSAKVAADSLAAVDLAADSVGASEIATGAVGTAEIATDGVQASDIAVSTVSADELAPVSEVSNTVSVAAGANGFASVACPAGSQVLSGGGITGSFTVMDLVDTTPVGNGWEVQARNESGGPLNLTAVALCLAA